MVRFDIISAVPDLMYSFLNQSILKRAQDKGIVEIQLHNLHDYGIGSQQKIDDYQFGGGAGMVMQIEPIHTLINKLKEQRSYDKVIYVTPDGMPFNQKIANQLSVSGNLIILCGHYKGIDQRVRDHLIDMEISVGEFVLSGGELPACIIVDAVGRLIPGVLNNECSALEDSHQDGMIAPPVYTRPASYNGWDVPDVLLSGNDAKIHAWRTEQSEKRTEEYISKYKN